MHNRILASQNCHFSNANQHLIIETQYFSNAERHISNADRIIAFYHYKIGISVMQISIIENQYFSDAVFLSLDTEWDL
jgi:hypothetical protein